jgi:alpha-1,6-mannosyltransferase
MSGLTVLDCNNFWSPTGGGVRRYHLEKLKYFCDRSEVKHVFVMPDTSTYQEVLGQGVYIEHVRSIKEPGTDGYRYVLNRNALRRVVNQHTPDIIEVGSPLFLPWLIRSVIRRTKPRPALVGFWHDDFPRTHLGRPARKFPPRIRESAEGLGWWWMRRTFASFDAMFVASKRVGTNMRRHGLRTCYYTPLGVDIDRFDRVRRDPDIVGTVNAGADDRISIFFPHRLSDEKGLSTVIQAYPLLCEKLPHAPALVFAGTGPGLRRVQEMARRYEHVRYLGYLESADDLARWYASSDIAVALSAFETFGLSAAEAMASGLALVGSDEGGAAELIEDSGCGITVPYGNTEDFVSAVSTLASEGRLKERGRLGRSHVSRFTWEGTFRNELACYRDVLQYSNAGMDVPEGLHDLTSDERRMVV